ncbi:MAG TPA: hypothetical protein VFZ95_05350 [Steroidobacteraceae bacterium]
MELDELKASWQRLDQRVQELTLMNRRLMLDAAVRRARRRLAPLLASAAVNVLIGAFFALAFAWFIGTHRETPFALIPAFMMFMTSLVYLAIGVGRLVLARRVDFTLPVLEIQRSLAAMQKWEAWSWLAMWVGSSLVPMAMLVALVIATHGTPSWQHMPAMVLANSTLWIVTALVPLTVYFVSRRRKGKFAAWVDSYLTSHSVADARAAIAEIDEFAEP